MSWCHTRVTIFNDVFHIIHIILYFINNIVLQSFNLLYVLYSGGNILWHSCNSHVDIFTLHVFKYFIFISISFSFITLRNLGLTPIAPIIIKPLKIRFWFGKLLLQIGIVILIFLFFSTFCLVPTARRWRHQV